MNKFSKFEDSYIQLDSNQIVESMKVLDINKMIDIYNLITLELKEINELESTFINGVS